LAGAAFGSAFFFFVVGFFFAIGLSPLVLEHEVITDEIDESDLTKTIRHRHPSHRRPNRRHHRPRCLHRQST
jgi:hypothetical protein